MIVRVTDDSVMRGLDRDQQVKRRGRGTVTRFILVTFAFLAWSFWYLSGGSDYESRVEATPIFAPAVPRESHQRISSGPDLLAAAQAAQGLSDVGTSPTIRLSPAPLSTEDDASDTEPLIDLQAAADRLAQIGQSGIDAGAGTIEGVLNNPALAEIALGGLSTDGLNASGLDAPGLAARGLESPSLDRSTLDGTLTGNLGNETAAQVAAAVNDALSGALTETLAGTLADTLGDDVATTVTGALTGQSVSQPSTPTAPSATFDADLREIIGDRVNMRAGPGTDFDVRAQLVRGDAVEVLNTEPDNWLRLRVVQTGEIGYMAGWLVSEAQ